LGKFLHNNRDIKTGEVWEGQSPSILKTFPLSWKDIHIIGHIRGAD
jgi:hypothetical protein